jgi:DNA-binding CsgD family transcriptional regulator
LGFVEAVPWPDGESELIERNAELAVIERFVEEARSGRAAVLLVEGPAGVGKSSLVAALRSRAGEHVLAASGSELERQVSFGLARRLLAGIAAPSRAPGTLARAVLDPTLADGPVPAPDAVAASLVDLVSELETPTTVVIDDLQWADPSSLLFLAQLAERVAELPCALVAALRSGEPSADDTLVTRIAGLASTVMLRPAPLSTAAVATLVAAALPGAPSETGARVARATAGNPYLVRELLLELRQLHARERESVLSVEDAPERVVRWIGARLVRLPPAAQALAPAVAVLGEAPLRRASALAELSPDEAATGADALSAAGILEPGEPLQFTHPVTASAVSAQVPPLRRGRLHARAAALLREEGEPPEIAANHLMRAPAEGDEAAVTTLLAAAAIDRERGEPVAAMRLLERALAEPPTTPERRAEVLVALGRNELAAGDVRAVEHFGGAIEDAADPELRVAAWHGLAQAHLAAGAVADSAASAARGRTELAPGDPREEVLLTDELTASGWQPELRENARELSDRLIADLRRGITPAYAPLGAVLASRLGLEGRAIEHIAPLARAATARDPLVHPDASAATLAGIAIGLLGIDELEVARSLLEPAIERARTLGNAPKEIVARAMRAHVMHLQGLLEDAERDLDALLATRLAGYEVFASLVVTTQARILLARGDVAGASAAMRVLEPFNPHQPGLRAEVGWLRLAQGRTHEALAEFLASGAFDEDILGYTNPGVIAWRRGAATALVRLGDREQAAELARAEATQARQSGGGRALALALSTLGTALTGDDGLAAHEEAVGLIDASPSRVWLAPVLLEHGAALRRAGKAIDARAPLRRAAKVADTLGLLGVASAARDELALAGGRAGRRSHDAGALTVGQLRVARLAADGASSPEIAKQLYLSRRTVESHLAAVYRKLDINSRSALRDALAAGDDHTSSASAVPPARRDT